MAEFQDMMMENAPLLTWDDMKVIPSNHSIDREIQRSSLAPPQWVQFFKKIIIKVKKLAELAKIRIDGEYLVYSPSLQQGMIITYRPERQIQNGPPQIIIVTVLPRGRKNPKPGTKLIFIECLEDETAFQSEAMDYMLENLELFADYIVENEVGWIEGIALELIEVE